MNNNNNNNDATFLFGFTVPLRENESLFNDVLNVLQSILQI